MKRCGIYCWLNTANGKRYIGQSVNLDLRSRSHMNLLLRRAHPNKHLQGSFVKYGREVFVFQTVEELDRAMLDARESFWIRYYRCNQPENGYNSETGGRIGKRVSEATKLKISKGHKGKVKSAEHRAHLSGALRGRVLSAEWRAAISKAHTGKRGYRHSAETRQKMSHPHKKKIIFPLPH